MAARRSAFCTAHDDPMRRLPRRHCAACQEHRRDHDHEPLDVTTCSANYVTSAACRTPDRGGVSASGSHRGMTRIPPKCEHLAATNYMHLLCPAGGRALRIGGVDERGNVGGSTAEPLEEAGPYPHRVDAAR